MDRQVVACIPPDSRKNTIYSRHKEGGWGCVQETRHQGSRRHIPCRVTEKKGLGSLELNSICTFLVVLDPKIPAACPGDAIHRIAPVLRGASSTRGCEPLIPTRVWGNLRYGVGGSAVAKPPKRMEVLSGKASEGLAVVLGPLF